jgi:DNA polymerase III delta' subunit
MTWLARHEKIKTRLDRLLQSDKLPHALLFCGPSGVGKEIVAKQFCNAALAQMARDQDMFGTATVVSSEAEHPDLIWIKPEEDEIKIGQVRDLPKQLSYAPLVSQVRFVVITNAEQLNVNAANFILKILEEPPAQTFFILLARDRRQVLQTIASRCQIVRFAPLSDAEITELGGEGPYLVASEGSLARQEQLQSLDEDGIWTLPAQLLLSLWRSGKVLPDFFALFDGLKGQDQALAVLGSWEALGRDALVGFATEGQWKRYYHPALSGDLGSWVTAVAHQNRRVRLEQLGLVAAVCNEARTQLNFNVNPRLVLESALARLAQIA